jgi:nitrate reductase assembly molybdenum cofactor insertion protein NarJ
VDGRVAERLRDAQTWHLLGRLLERPRAGWREDVGALARDADADVAEAAGRAGAATEAGYLQSFGPSGAVSPREVAHCGMRDPGQLLADLAARYGAFGFHPASEDPIDHVAVEAGFVAYLRLKEAAAIFERDRERAAIAAEACEAFMRDHLRELAEPIARALRDGPEAHLAAAVRALARRTGSKPASRSPKVFWLEDASESWSCGA